MTNIIKPKILLFFAFLGLFSCDEENQTPSLRAKVDYATLTPATPYASAFVDASGNTTADLFEGNTRYKMFYAINTYMSSRISANEQIDATVLGNMFSNTGNPFTDISTPSITGEELNSSGVQLRNVVASSQPAAEAEAVRAKLEGYFTAIETASQYVSQPASQGIAGKLGNYLVDEKGIEIAQVIQKSLIGALQLDYIGNVLMDEGLNADNSQVVSDKKYTQLEHNWDEAYGLLTLKEIYLEGYTNDSKGTVTEFGAGAYIWEFNRANYDKIYPALLKGRAAIVNNDKAELQAQATFIRTEFEKTLANAALGYLGKWKIYSAEGNVPASAHAIGEALGFIYSLRFCELHGADAAFSDKVWTDLIDSPNGFWDLDHIKINAASDAIKLKFGL